MVLPPPPYISELPRSKREEADSTMAKPLLCAILLLLPLAVAAEDRPNGSAWSGLHWSTARNESDLLAKAEPYAEVDAGGDEFDGGFSSLDGMLQWAIGNSDPEKLKEKASDVKLLSADELQKRHEEIKELMEKVKMPTDAELMQIAINDLRNSSLSLEDRHRALNELLILVEPIDNANDLNKLGGLVAVISELQNPEHDIRTTSAWILGKACQNNALVQKQILDLGALPRLIKMVKSSHSEEAIKALYAVSALIRNNPDGQEVFYTETGELVLQDIMRNPTSDKRLVKKVVFLVADLADFQTERTEAQFPFFENHRFLKAVVDLLSSSDLDLQEKTLLAIRSLLQISSMEAMVFKDHCNLNGALARLGEELEKMSADDDWGDFARDVESLRREVHLLFHKKLEKVMTVPT